MKKVVIRSVITVGLLLLATVSFAKPTPPQTLTDILGETSELEEKFEKGDWVGARETLEEIKEMYSEVYTEYKNQLPTALNKNFNSSASSLDQFLEAKHEENSENEFITLRVVLFATMDYFDYKVHPIIKVLQKYIGEEAQQALADNDLKNVQSELKEVASFFLKNASLFKVRGVGNDDLEKFMLTLGNAIKQADLEDTVPLKKSLDDLEKQIAVFQQTSS
jgi:hypothetical protein